MSNDNKPLGNPVIIRGVAIPFWDLVNLWLGVTLAAVPALVLLWMVSLVLGGFAWLALTTLFG